MFLIIFLAVYLFILYYFFIGRRRKEKKKKEELISSLSKGTRVSTISGLRGTVVSIADDHVIVELSADPARSIKAHIVKAGIKGVVS